MSTCFSSKDDMLIYLRTLKPTVYDPTIHSFCKDQVLSDSIVCDFWDSFMDYAPCILEFQKENLSHSLYEDIKQFWENCKWDSEDDWEKISRESILQENEMELYMRVYRKKDSSRKDAQIIRNFLTYQKVSEKFFWANANTFASFVDNRIADDLTLRFLEERVTPKYNS